MMAEKDKLAKVHTIEDYLDSPTLKAKIKKALPRHLSADRFIRITCATIMRTPKLAECDKVSFFDALMKLSQLGLEPDGRRAHLLPFNNTEKRIVECVLIIDYKGLVELAMRSGAVGNIHADVVRDNDEFEYDRGVIVKHRIDFKKKRGNVYAAYSICRMKDGTEKAEVMSRDDIEAIRKRSKSPNKGPWVTDWDEMAKKTVFRRLSKWIPQTPDLRKGLESDSEFMDLGDSDDALPPRTFTKGADEGNALPPAKDPGKQKDPAAEEKPPAESPFKKQEPEPKEPEPEPKEPEPDPDPQGPKEEMREPGQDDEPGPDDQPPADYQMGRQTPQPEENPSGLPPVNVRDKQKFAAELLEYFSGNQADIAHWLRETTKNQHCPKGISKLDSIENQPQLNFLKDMLRRKSGKKS